jgi:hypothetical protein
MPLLILLWVISSLYISVGCYDQAATKPRIGGLGFQVCWMVSVDRRRNKDVCRTHYALTAVLVILPARWADVALQPLVSLSVRQVEHSPAAIT